MLERRLSQLAAEGVEFRCGVSVGLPPSGAAGESGTTGTNGLEPGLERGLGTACAVGVEVVSGQELLDENDAVVLACGATLPRELEVPGRQLRGVHLALEYLKPSNLVREGLLEESPLSAAGKRVVIIGGGDTGADCLGTAHRQGAAEVRQLEILPQPPDVRPEDNPWPTWPLIMRTSSAHEEGGDRIYAVETTELVDDGTGAVAGLRAHQVRQVVEDGRVRFEPLPSSTVEIPCELVLIAMGFVGAERMGVVSELGLELDARGNVACDSQWASSREGVFVCGDVTRGQSLDRLGDRRRKVVRCGGGPMVDGGDGAAVSAHSRATGHPMSDAPQGPDWQQGPDGKWYPPVGGVADPGWGTPVEPEVPPPPTPPPTPPGGPSGPFDPSGPYGPGTPSGPFGPGRPGGPYGPSGPSGPYGPGGSGQGGPGSPGGGGGRNNQRTILISVVGVLVAGGIAAGLYFGLKHNSTPTSTTSPPQTTVHTTTPSTTPSTAPTTTSPTTPTSETTVPTTTATTF